MLLAGPARSRLFEETTDGDVAQAIAADYNLSAKVESGPSRRPLSMTAAPIGPPSSSAPRPSAG